MRWVPAPRAGLWRIGRAPDPLAVRTLRREELDDPNLANRFDSPLGEFGVRYFGTAVEGCFGETLARFRPDLKLQAIAEEAGFMPLGEVPADWRQRRLAAHVEVPAACRFLDVEHLDSRERLRHELASILTGLGHKDLDVATIRGGDRRLTRWIADWAYRYEDDEGTLAGIRYLSRLNSSWECWAVFEDVKFEGDAALRPILREDPALLRVANQYGLRVF